MTTETVEPFLQVLGVSKSFTTGQPARVVRALDDVNLDVTKGEFLTVIGPSGCGKSTLLDCIAGLTAWDRGAITIDGHPVSGPGSQRVVVFQSASLLPWRTVERNIAYGAELAGWSRARIAEQVDLTIELVGLRGFEKHYPRQLSGGMQQRVNLGRALMMDAELILMDEPFGALDAMTKRAMQEELLLLHSRLDRTFVFITHDLDEAIYLGDRIAVMGTNPGRLKELRDVPFSRPRSRDIVDTPEFRQISQELSRSLHPSRT